MVPIQKGKHNLFYFKIVYGCYLILIQFIHLMIRKYIKLLRIFYKLGTFFLITKTKKTGTAVEHKLNFRKSQEKKELLQTKSIKAGYVHLQIII